MTYTDLKWKIERTLEKLGMFVARNLPKRVRLWVVVLAQVKACKATNSYPGTADFKQMHDAV